VASQAGSWNAGRDLRAVTETENFGLLWCFPGSEGFFFSQSHKSDLLEFRPLYSEKCSHLNDLIGTHGVVWVGAEFLQTSVKLAATHSLWDIEPELAFEILPVMQTEFADDHCRRLQLDS
jgi:hypothetical protein